MDGLLVLKVLFEPYHFPCNVYKAFNDVIHESVNNYEWKTFYENQSVGCLYDIEMS